MAVEFRFCEEADLPQLKALHDQISGQWGFPAPPDYYYANAVAMRRCVVGEDAGNIVAYYLWGERDSVCVGVDLGVVPAYRSIEVGRGLCDFVLDILRSRDIKTIHISTPELDNVSLAFQAARGNIYVDTIVGLNGIRLQRFIKNI